MLNVINKFYKVFGTLTVVSLISAAAPTVSAAPVESPSAQDAATQHAAEESGRSLSLPLNDVPKPWIAAHRGQWRSFPENSIPAVLKSIEDGAQVVEVDIKRTSDGELVLMHDNTVDRTTTGTGAVSEMTLDEIKSLQLREGQGNGPAPATDLKVPTFREALEAVRSENVLLNLDKGWEYREQLYAELAQADMVAYGFFKGAPSVAEATEFMDAHPDAQYMHIVNDDQSGHVEEFGDNLPHAIEIAWDSPEDIQGTDAFWADLNERTDLFANSMWNSVGGGYTDEASLRDPEEGWAYHVARGAGVIQTDHVGAIDAWRDGQDVTRYGMNEDSIRVQAEDYVDDPGWYSDNNPENECADPVRLRGNPVDACNLDGAHVIQYIRDGEFFALDTQVPETGVYRLSMRQSADTEPGGTVTVELADGASETVDLPNTTHNRHFVEVDLGEFHLEKGTERLKFSFTHPDYLSVDWVQLDPVPADEGTPMRTEDRPCPLAPPQACSPPAAVRFYDLIIPEEQTSGTSRRTCWYRPRAC